MTRTRLFIIHENQTFANQVMAHFAQNDQIRALDALSTVNEALAFIGQDNCDLLLISATLPQNGALKLIKSLRQRGVTAKMIVTGLADDVRHIVRYISAGAAGYTLQGDSIDSWGRQIEALRAGKALLSPSVVARLMAQLSTLSRLTARYEPQAARYGDLTEREIEVFRMLAHGSSNQEIADTLIIGVGTVKNHVHNILKKLNLRNRREAATYLSFIENKTQSTAVQYQ
jgi:DNA-binding NarL/FixJ family response regulator